MNAHWEYSENFTIKVPYIYSIHHVSFLKMVLNCPWLHQMLIDFLNSFTVRLIRKCIMKQLSKISPYLKCIADAAGTLVLMYVTFTALDRSLPLCMLLVWTQAMKYIWLHITTPKHTYLLLVLYHPPKPFYNSFYNTISSRHWRVGLRIPWCYNVYYWRF